MGLLGRHKVILNNLLLSAVGGLTGSMIRSIWKATEALEFFAESGLKPILEMIQLGEASRQ
jgi:D-arabinose 1-dehydrogenase-like Zn-dependent alcohol dehydrogenase